jgi:enoyl-CoA hydratase/carnithine racemase
MSNNVTHFNCEITGGLATVSLDRPDRKNPLSFDSYAELRDWFRDLHYDDSIRAVIFAPNGGNFSSGGDVHDIIGPLTKMTMKELLTFTRMTGDLVKAMIGCGKPIIAAVNGNALGGGTEMMNACDLRVASENAIFGTPEAKVGLLPGGGSITRLPRQIPYAKMMEMLLVGRPFSAQEALDMGLLNYVVPRGELMDKAMELAEMLAENGPLAVSKIKEGVIRSSGLPLSESYQIENEVSAAVMTSKDAREGPRAFKEKRKPNFTGE